MPIGVWMHDVGQLMGTHVHGPLVHLGCPRLQDFHESLPDCTILAVPVLRPAGCKYELPYFFLLNAVVRFAATFPHR